MGATNDGIRLQFLRAELRKERARRVLAEQTLATLRDEINRTREFLEGLQGLGLSFEAVAAVQEFLMGAPHVAGSTDDTEPPESG